MKKLLYAHLLMLICLSGVAQFNPSQWQLLSGGPPAGEVWDELPVIPGQKAISQKELDYDSLNMQFTGNWPYGQSFSVSSSSSGDTVFFGSGAGMLIVDATDPFNPVQLSEIRARSLIDHSYYDASSGLLFLAAYFSGVEIWDVSDIINPVRIARIPLNSYPRGGIYAKDGVLYVVTVADGMYIYNISNPAVPGLMAHQNISGSLVWTSSFDGDYAYLSQGSSGVKIVDISDPWTPSIAGVFNTNATGILVEDQTAYIVASDFGLRTFDVSDPSGVTPMGELPIDGYPARIAKAGNHLYITNSTSNPEGGINAVDVSDPQNPLLITTIDPPETYISGAGNVVAATGNSSGLLLVDISDPVNPLYASELNTAWSTIDIAVSGDYAYTGSNGFRVFDMSDPSYPLQVGFEPTQGAIARISDTLAVYIPQSMGSGNRVNIMDISEPANPVFVDYYAPPVMTNELALKGHYAYVACWWDGFRTVDFSDPYNVVLASHDFGWVNGAVPGEEFCYVQTLDVYGDYLYVLDYGPFPDQDSKGLYIWDISTPDEPVLLKRFIDLVSDGHDLRAWGDYVYISDKLGGLEVINVADPMNPYTTGYITLTDAAWSMDLSWPYAYVSQYILGGVHIVNVMDPADPQLWAYYQRSGCFALGVTAWDNYAVVADGPAGMQVYDFMLATGTTEQEEQATESMRVFPQPALSHVTISFELETADNLRLSIFDLSGKFVKEHHIGKMAPGTCNKTIALEGLDAGLYMIRVTGASFIASGRLLVGR